jgi:hypothetical protein
MYEKIEYNLVIISNILNYNKRFSGITKCFSQINVKNFRRIKLNLTSDQIEYFEEERINIPKLIFSSKTGSFKFQITYNYFVC